MTATPALLFFVRHEIDLDHYAPIIDHWMDREAGAVVCIIFNPKKTFLGDWRVQHLQQRSVTFFQVTKLMGIPRLLRAIASRPSSNKSGVRRASSFFFNRFIKYPVDRYLERKLRLINCEKVFSRITDRWSPKLFIFDHKESIAYSRVCVYADRHSIPTLAIPHGPSFASPMVQREPPERVGVGSGRHLPYDYLVASDEIQKAVLDRLSDRVTLLGEPRFALDWVKKLRDLSPSGKLWETPRNALRIVYMAKKEELGRYDVSALNTALDGIAKLPDVFLVIKGHPRSIPPSIEGKPNIVLASEEQSSSALMRWADLILFTHTSIVLEALQLKKPILYLKFAVLVTPNSEQFEMGWEVRSEQDLINRVAAISDDRAGPTYSEEARKRCIDFWVSPRGQDVRKLFGDFISALSQKTP